MYRKTVEQFHLAAEPLATNYADVVLGRKGPLEAIGLRSLPVEFGGFTPDDVRVHSFLLTSSLTLKAANN